MEKFLRYIINISFGIVLVVTPFVVTSSMFFPFITGKNILFRIAVEVMFSSWLLLTIRDATYRPRKSLILFGVLAFLAIIGIANLFGGNLSQSFWSNFERMEGYVTLLHFAALVLVASSAFNTQKIWSIFINTSIGASMIMAGYTFLQLGGVLTINQSNRRVDGTLGNATYLAVYMLFHTFLTLLMLVRHKGASYVKWIYGLAFIVQVFVLFETATRGAILGLFGGLILTALLVVLFERTYISYRKFARTTLIVLVLLGGLFFIGRETEIIKNSPTLNRLGSISLESKTVRSRLILWGSTSIEGFKERPILGWGQEGFGDVFSKYYDPRMYDQEPWFDRSHNVVFDWLIAGGILGLASYLFLFGATLFMLWRPKSNIPIVERSILTGLLAGYFFHNLFVFDNIVSYILFGTILSYVHTSSHEESDVRESTSARSTSLQHVATLLVLIVFVFSLYTFSIKPAVAASTLLDALRPQPALEDNLALYEESFAKGTIGKKETLVQLFQVTTSVIGSPDVPQELKQSFGTTAISFGEAESERTPDNVRHELFFGIFLMRLGLFDQAGPHLEHARELAPNKQQVLLSVGQYYFNVGDIDSGLEALKHAYEVAPQFEDPAGTYSGALIRVGKNAIAEQVLLDTFGTIDVTHPDVINAYEAVGNATRAQELRGLPEGQ